MPSLPKAAQASTNAIAAPGDGSGRFVLLI